MILNNNYKTIDIDIITYKTKQPEKCNSKVMNENIVERYRNCNQNRFICSICLNKKASQDDDKNKECCKRKSKSCPICQKPCEIDESKSRHQKHDDRVKEDKNPKIYNVNEDINGKKVQTSQSDVTKGLTLLNEVLTVFQTKKQLENKKENASKTIILKDASVETDMQKNKRKLSISKTFLYSLEENDGNLKNGKFLIINSQPKTVVRSQFSIDLKHKSSSIPQMKLEELKQSLKEKTKSKDAIEEVNRMFAIVRKTELGDSADDSNRPMIRSGPRVLPVVKTPYHSENRNTTVEKLDCYNCRTSYQMCSGDSMQKCCYKQERCDNCCKTCCHYKHRCFEKVCDHCCSNNKDCNFSMDANDG